MSRALVDTWWGPVVVRDRLGASPEAVYAVLADPDTYPDWLVGAARMRAADPAFPAPGAEFHHSVGPAKGLTVDDTSESLGAEPDRHLALLVHAGPFHARVDFHLEPAGNGGTEISFSEQPVGPLAVLTPILRPTLAGRNKLSLEQLKKLVA